MKGWIIYNGYYKSESTEKLVEILCSNFSALGVEMQKIPSNRIVFSYDENGEIKQITDFAKPDFAIFWDKDINLARILEKWGLRLFNKSHAIEVCDSKIFTYQMLCNNGLRLAPTIFHPFVYPISNQADEEFIDLIISTLGLPVVVKESYGSFGMQVYKADDRLQLMQMREKLLHVPHLYQQFVGTSIGTDMRLIVIGGKVVAGMKRQNSKDFRANIELGGIGSVSVPTSEYAEAAIKAAKILELDYCGVDLLFGENGPVICEVNSNAYFHAISACSGVDIAKEYALYVVRQVGYKC